MKKKLVGILVCTLLISTGTIAIADWDEGDLFKMHFPQLPYPDGFDVDWAFGPLVTDSAFPIQVQIRTSDPNAHLGDHGYEP